MSKHTVTACVPFCDDYMVCAITFNFTRGRPAVMYLRNGDPGYPADPDEVEFVSVQVEDGVVLPDHYQKCLTDWAVEWLADSDNYAAVCASALDDIEYDRELAAEMRAELAKEDRR